MEHCKFVAGTNPTGPGHGWVRKLWVDRDFRNEPDALKMEDFAYVPAKATDNPFLPSSYFTQTLASLPEFMRKALMDGSWDVIENQYFLEWNGDLHVRAPRPVQEDITDKWGIPLSWQRVGGIDWGRAAPWAAHEAAIDPDGRVIVYRSVAETQWDHERQADWLRAGSPKVTWFADKACWAKSAANSKESRAMDMSHAELWGKYGATNIMPAVGGDRVAGWQHVSAFLKKMPRILKVEAKKKTEDQLTADDYEPDRAWIEFFDVPGLKGDHGIISTLPRLVRDPNRPEDVDTECDDHAADALRYLLQSRPSPTQTAKRKNPYKKGDWFSRRGEVELDEDGDPIWPTGNPKATTVGNF